MIDLLGQAEIIRGAALGLAIAAPIGPASLLCIQRTLAGGARQGWATGAGIATVHVLYGSLATAGLTVVADLVADWTVLLQVCGGVFLLRIALRTLRRAPVQLGASARRVPTWQAYATGLALTLGNPMTLLGFAALTPGIVGPAADSWRSVPAVAGGVALGSAAWWMLLATAVACARSRLNARRLQQVNLAAGAALVLFAGAILVGAAGWRLGADQAGSAIARASIDDAS